jgi:hypothetical protein
MPSPNTPRRRQPTWRRLAGGSLGLFFVVLAFLAGRMGAGADPALSDSKSETKKASTQQSTSTSDTSDAYDDSTSQATDPDPPTTSAS